ncbi:hypothetical protein FBU59_005655 [Linderina macrospora]|uniref:Uncharacterized protein n=1 Tax=Linderina macrospora TaxID=4868 RepID=A0ACC1J272_9FUNG|nr:hypothetical protein FBU59_005655 [Linderina macrospora]
MSDATAKNKILVLSRASVNTARLVNEIVSRPALDASQGGTIAQVPWTITTKYFSAPVEFWVDHTEPLDSKHQQFMQAWVASKDPSLEASESEIPVDESMNELHVHLGEVTDSVVFVFDPAQPESFYDILPWAKFAMTQSPSVLLCVAMGASQGSEEDSDRWFRWCIGNGWEWVDLTDTDPDSEYSVSRIREALEANEWSTMKMKSREAEPAAKPAAGEPGPTADSDSDNGPRPTDGKTLDEWDQFERVAGQIDASRVTALNRSFFADGMLDGDEMATALEKIRQARDEIGQMDDPEQARLRAAELALAIAKRM